MYLWQKYKKYVMAYRIVFVRLLRGRRKHCIKSLHRTMATIFTTVNRSVKIVPRSVKLCLVQLWTAHVLDVNCQWCKKAGSFRVKLIALARAHKTKTENGALKAEPTSVKATAKLLTLVMQLCSVPQGTHRTHFGTTKEWNSVCDPFGSMNSKETMCFSK